MRSQAQYLPSLLLILAIFLRSSYSLLGSCGVRRCGTGRYINTRLNRGNTLYSSRSSQKAPKEIEERWDLDDSAEAEREEQADEDEILGIQDDVDFKSGFVSILGNPNVGKSTLLNAFLGNEQTVIIPSS